MKTCIRFRTLLRAVAVCVLALMLTSCEEGPFNAGQAAGVLNSQSVRLDGEQVQLNEDQVSCGVQNELWSVEREADGTGKAVLTPAGRALHFDDSVKFGDSAETAAPRVQIRGEFKLASAAVDQIKDIDAQTKTVSARVGVVIDHACFGGGGLPLLGVRHGQFTTNTPPVFRFRLGNGWAVDQVMH